MFVPLPQNLYSWKAKTKTGFDKKERKQDEQDKEEKRGGTNGFDYLPVKMSVSADHFELLVHDLGDRVTWLDLVLHHLSQDVANGDHALDLPVAQRVQHRGYVCAQ